MATTTTTQTEKPAGIRTTMERLAKDYANAIAAGNEHLAQEMADRYNRYAERYDFDPLA